MPRLSGIRRGGDDSAHFAGVDCLTNFSGLDVDGAEQARASVVRDDVAGRFISDCDAGDPERNHSGGFFYVLQFAETVLAQHDRRPAAVAPVRGQKV